MNKYQSVELVPQRTFEITFGLRPSNVNNPHRYSEEDAKKAILKWMTTQVSNKEAVLHGMLSEARPILFAEKKVWCAYPIEIEERGLVFSGAFDYSDRKTKLKKLVDRVNSLADWIGAELAQDRICVSVAGQSWVRQVIKA